MRLATIRTAAGTSAVRIEGHTAIECPATDVGALLATPNWQAAAALASGAEHAVAGLDYAPVIPQPSKIICVGLNYRSHITEMGRELPTYPTLFVDVLGRRRGGSARPVAVCASDRARPDFPADDDKSWVEGRAAELARWLVGRGGAEALQTFDGAPLPELSPWL